MGGSFSLLPSLPWSILLRVSRGCFPREVCRVAYPTPDGGSALCWRQTLSCEDYVLNKIGTFSMSFTTLRRSQVIPEAT